MKERIFVFLFALPFAGVGLGLLVMSVIPTLYDWTRMQSWTSVSAQLTHAKLERHYSDSTTYQATAEYRYTWQGLRYSGDRAAINTSADNIGDFQSRLGNRLEKSFRQKKAIDIWVNPESPDESIINRDLRWGLLGFKMIFVMVFGGIGLGILYFSIKAEKEEEHDVTLISTEPWLENSKWQSKRISSNAREGGRILWGFAIIWNLVSSPILFVLPEELQRGNYLALIGLIFPLIGIGMLYVAVMRSLRWRRFGPTPFEMRKFPGRLGEVLRGRIEIKENYDPERSFDLMLSCIYCYDTDDGQRERLVWQDKKVVAAQPGMLGTRIEVEFDIPADQPASTIADSNYHKWVLDVDGELKGLDYKRQFEIPVYPGTASLAQTEKPDTTGSADPARKKTSTRTPSLRGFDVESLLGIRHGAGGFTWRYPAFRNPGMGMGLLAFGLLSGGSAVFIAMVTFHELPGSSFFANAVSLFQSTIGLIMTGAFGLLGLGFLLGGLYVCGNSLTLVVQSGKLHYQRRLYGIPLRAHVLDLGDIRKVEKKVNFTSSSGSKHKINYRVMAITNLRKAYTLAENIHSASEADAVVHYFKTQLKLNPVT